MRIEIPSYVYDDPVTIALPYGYSATVACVRDDDMGPPWEEHDGHGPVSEWTTRDPEEGELVLIRDGHSRRYYDGAAALELAKKEGWNAPPYSKVPLEEKAVRAVAHDFKWLKRWCDDEWHWIGVVTETFYRGDKIGEDALWGIESEGDYWQTVAHDMIEGQIESFKVDRIAQAKRTRTELRERAHWAARGVQTGEGRVVYQ